MGDDRVAVVAVLGSCLVPFAAPTLSLQRASPSRLSFIPHDKSGSRWCRDCHERNQVQRYKCLGWVCMVF